jgi:hypothetical protein
MSADPCDFASDDFDWNVDRSVMGEWLQMNFPLGCLDIYNDSPDPDPRLYLTIEFDNGNAVFLLKEAENETGLRGRNDHTICWFTLSPDMLNRISRVARS